MLEVIRKFEGNTIFSESEAWMLFRIAAIGEAVGWTLLTSGILIGKYVVPGNSIPVLLAGRIHGMLFLVYMLAAIGLYPSLRWSRRRAFVALLMCVPPYGSIAFERWAHYTRQHAQFRTFRCCLALAALDE